MIHGLRKIVVPNYVLNKFSFFGLLHAQILFDGVNNKMISNIKKTHIVCTYHTIFEMFYSYQVLKI